MRCTRIPLAALWFAAACTRYKYVREQCPPSPPSRSRVLIDSASGPRGAIAGIVETTDSAVRVAGVTLRLATPARTVLSDSLGRFRFDSLPPAIYALSAHLIGLMPGHASVTMSAEHGAQVRVLLEQRPLMFDGCGSVLIPVKKPWWKFW